MKVIKSQNYLAKWCWYGDALKLAHPCTKVWPSNFLNLPYFKGQDLSNLAVLLTCECMHAQWTSYRNVGEMLFIPLGWKLLANMACSPGHFACRKLRQCTKSMKVIILVRKAELKQNELVVQVNRNFVQNRRRKYDRKTSECVLCSFMYCSLAVRSHLAVKFIAPRVPESQTPETVIKDKINLCQGRCASVVQ